MSLFLSYFIVTYQFQPEMDYDYFNKSFASDVFAGKIPNPEDQDARHNYIVKYVSKFEAPPKYVQDVINGINQIFNPQQPTNVG